MSYNYIKCSHEQYTVDLHLKIKRYTCIVSIFKKLSVVWWLEMTLSELEQQLQDLQNLGKNVIWVYEFTTQRSSTTRHEYTRGSQWSDIKLHWFWTRILIGILGWSGMRARDKLQKGQHELGKKFPWTIAWQIMRLRQHDFDISWRCRRQHKLSICLE